MNNQILIELKEVSKHYEDGQVKALDRVTMQVVKGDFFFIRGPSGSGKSTLLHLMGGLDSPTSGSIYFEGQSFEQTLKQGAFRIRKIGFVFQAFYLWPTLNVLENILLPLMEIPLARKEKMGRADELIKTFGLSQKRLSRISTLSMGERQRVAIARALVTNPAVILADEPTGSLDSKNAENIMSILKLLNKEQGVTIVIVTHEKRLDSYFDCGIELFDGVIKRTLP